MGGSAPPLAGIAARSSSPGRRRRREGLVVSVHVEQGVHLVGLLRQLADGLDPFAELLGRVLPVEPLPRLRRAADVPGAPVATVEADVGDTVCRRRDSRHDVGRSCARRVHRDERAFRARGTRTFRPARPRPARSGGGTRSAARADRAGRTCASSAFASSDFLKRGWYWSSTPRHFPESSSGDNASRKAANAASMLSASRWCVISPLALTWKTNSGASAPPTSPPRRAPAGRRTSSRPRRCRSGRVVPQPLLGGRDALGYQVLTRPSSAQLHVPSRTVAGMPGRYGVRPEA